MCHFLYITVTWKTWYFSGVCSRLKYWWRPRFQFPLMMANCINKYLFLVWEYVFLCLLNVPRRPRKAVGPGCYHRHLIIAVTHCTEVIQHPAKKWRGRLSSNPFFPTWERSLCRAEVRSIVLINQSINQVVALVSLNVLQENSDLPIKWNVP